jgi:hypothetical protein
MSVSGILSSSFYQPNTSQSQPTQFQSIAKEFQQLGQDLQTGNINQAQQDFSTLAQNVPNGAINASPVGQAFTALGQAVQSGNLSNAQQAFTNLEQDIQQASSQIGHRHSHGHHHAPNEPLIPPSGASSGSASTNPLAQDFSSLGQALQSGNLAAAQQAYSAIEQGLQQFGAFGSNNASSVNQAPTTSLNVTA